MYRVIHVPLRRGLALLAGMIVCMSLSAFWNGNGKRALAVSSDAPSQEEKTVYLTFDDGPSENTAHLLDVLKKHNVEATFFLIGPVDAVKSQYSQLLGRMVEEGHTLAPHSYSHNYSNIYASKEAFFEDFDLISSEVQQALGKPSKLYRFPGGSANREAPAWVLDQVVEELGKRGITYYDWNVVSGDDTAVVYSPETLYNNVMEQVEPFSTAVVLFHDASLCSTTADAVDLLIPALKEQGWRFKAIIEGTEPLQFHQ